MAELEKYDEFVETVGKQIENARERVWVFTPFVDTQFIRVLLNKAGEGANVMLVTTDTPENKDALSLIGINVLTPEEKEYRKARRNFLLWYFDSAIAVGVFFLIAAILLMPFVGVPIAAAIIGLLAFYLYRRRKLKTIRSPLRSFRAYVLRTDGAVMALPDMAVFDNVGIRGTQIVTDPGEVNNIAREIQELPSKYKLHSVVT